MAITQALCSSFKQELFQGLHNFTTSTGNAFKMALYTSTATINANTTAYSATNEASGSGYTAGGLALTNITPTLSASTAIVSFGNASWTNSTITARGALIYNSTNANRAVCVLDFGTDLSTTAGTFLVVMPTADVNNAILRLT